MYIIGVIGAGAMGSGIAQVAAQNNHPTILFDANEAVLDKAKASIEKSINTLIEKQKLTAEQGAKTLANLTYAKDIKAFSDCNLIIEAIIENLDIKKKVFAQVEEVVKPSCILASNTSSLSIASISSACKTPERVVGIHFFNPATIMPLVEIIPGVATDPTIVEEAKELINTWKKITVVCKDTPGFIVNRVARSFYGEAIRIVEEDIADMQTVDWAMKELGGFRMGPFELMDFIGHDVNYKVTETVWEQLFYDPRFKPSLTQKRLYEAGFFGKKTGRGFYNYTNPQAIEPHKDEELGKYILNRILCMLINEAIDTYYLKVADKEAIEIAMTKGVNYPKGLLAWCDEIGVTNVYNTINTLYTQYAEDRYRPSILLKTMAHKKERFFNAQTA